MSYLQSSDTIPGSNRVIFVMFITYYFTKTPFSKAQVTILPSYMKLLFFIATNPPTFPECASSPFSVFYPFHTKIFPLAPPVIATPKIMFFIKILLNNIFIEKN